MCNFDVNAILILNIKNVLIYVFGVDYFKAKKMCILYLLFSLGCRQGWASTATFSEKI